MGSLLCNGCSAGLFHIAPSKQQRPALLPAPPPPPAAPPEPIRALTAGIVDGELMDVNLSSIATSKHAPAQLPAPPPAPAAPPEPSRAMTARIVDGDFIDVDFAAFDSVGQVKLHIAEVRGESPEAILLLDGDGTELGDVRLLSTVASELHVMVIGNLTPVAKSGNRSPVSFHNRADHALTARIVDGNLIDVSLVDVESVGQAKLCISEALGENPDAIITLDENGSELGDGQLLSSACASELQVLIARKLTPVTPTTNPSSAISVKMAMTGEALDIAVDPTLPVAAARQQIAAALGKCDDTVKLVASDGQELADSDVLSTLGLSELGVVKKHLTLCPLESNLPVTPSQKAYAISRLTKEFRGFVQMTEGLEFTADIADDAAEDPIFCWRIHFPWPEGVRHSEDLCEIIVRVPHSYPFVPPEFHVVGDVQHWAISATGKVLMDVLSDLWTPAFTIAALTKALQSLLSEQAPMSLTTS